MLQELRDCMKDTQSRVPPAVSPSSCFPTRFIHFQFTLPVFFFSDRYLIFHSFLHKGSAPHIQQSFMEITLYQLMKIIFFLIATQHCTGGLFNQRPWDLGGFQPSAITNNATVSKLVHMLLQVCGSESSVEIPRNSIVGSEGKFHSVLLALPNSSLWEAGPILYSQMFPLSLPTEYILSKFFSFCQSYLKVGILGYLGGSVVG